MKLSLVVVATALMCPLLAAAPDPQPPSPDKRPTFERGMMVRFHMHENFGTVRAIERLLLRGKLDNAKFGQDAWIETNKYGLDELHWFNMAGQEQVDIIHEIEQFDISGTYYTYDQLLI